ncbi:MAG TPA: CRTAC1 family protein [Chthonomonas sp.]|uniref:CRTAC1 family protein n=1 Tax=Chthonomonas sp. TaxID=2282153 RepID=UPI002B4B3709|nr:CRTAC1 family protein [Chthonomonas sp.]HLH79724.1 CRTAC1 family protein [Chthonomonas sp.]
MKRRIARREVLGLFLGTVLGSLGDGCGHDPIPQSGKAGQRFLFRDVAAEAGIDFTLGHTSPMQVNTLEAIGHGCAFLDYDNDGHLDILLVSSPRPRLYRNLGNGRFEDVTETVLPPPPPHAHFLGCSVADYDRDGYLDILLTGYGTRALYHNEGGKKFHDVTSGSGLEAHGPYDWSTGAAWADIDGSGRLCVYIGRYVRFTPYSKQLCSYKGINGSSVMMACGPDSYPSEYGALYRYDGNGRFVDITEKSGMLSHGNTLGCLFCDFNNDGLPDLYLANDLEPADLFLNLGDGRFANIAVASGTAYGADASLQSGMGIDWGDYDNDGRFDLIVANYAQKPKSLFHNEGHDLFTNQSYPSGIGAASLLPLSFGAVFIDFDNDGLLDIVFTNGHVESQIRKVDPTQTYRQSAQLFQNRDGSHFVDISARAGPDFTRRIVGRGIAVGDYDNDGLLDLLVVDEEGKALLLHNETPTTNHWIRFRCVEGEKNTYAIGAKVLIESKIGRRIAEVRAGGSYLSANAPDVHFGLGQVTTVDAIHIFWPNGQKHTFYKLAADRLYLIHRETKSLEPLL